LKRVYTADDPILVGYLKSVLADYGIDCMIRNEMLIGGTGELPPNECWPELWVLEDADEATARSLLESALAKQADETERWHCTACGEESEPQFAACWRCGAIRGSL
jgi:hypothetical protein